MIKAARFYAQKDIRVELVPLPTPKPGQVLVDVEWCGICGSDLHEYLKGPLVIPREGQPHPLTGSHLPVTLGHEFCGRIQDSNGVKNLSVGQPVMIDPRLYCTSCHRCKGGSINMCLQWGFLGLSGSGGGLSEVVAVDADACHALPPDVDMSIAALIEPLTVARHALKSAGISSESWKDLSVLVLGGGPVGLAVVRDLKVHEAKKIIVSEPSPERRSQVAKHCDEALDPTELSVPETCRKLTADHGVDVVFDCAGVTPALTAGFDAVRSNGTIVNVAGWEAPPTLPYGFFHMKEIVYRASMSYTTEDFTEVVGDFVSGRYGDLDEMITARIALTDVAQKGFDELIQNKDRHVKILVTPKDDLL